MVVKPGFCIGVTLVPWGLPLLLSAKAVALEWTHNQNAIQSPSSHNVWRAPLWLIIKGRSEETLLWSHESYIEEMPLPSRPARNSSHRQVHMARDLRNRCRCLRYWIWPSYGRSPYTQTHNLHHDSKVVHAVASTTECALTTLAFGVIIEVTSQSVFAVLTDNFKARQSKLVGLCERHPPVKKPTCPKSSPLVTQPEVSPET